MRLLFFLVLAASTLCLLVNSASTITHLPGFNNALPFHLETGYVTVDDVIQAELFYYFVESERNPSEDPVILWLTGGPGCSSFYGLVREIGPVRFKVAPYNGTLPTLVYNPHAWTKVSNIIFLDWPALCGFSTVKSVKDYVGDDLKSSKEIYNFIKQWFLDHPRFHSNPFYVGGNSYGGKMVPIVAQKIAQGIEAGKQPIINLKGYICGNPVTDSLVDGNSRVPYAHGVGILPDELVEEIKRSCSGENYKKPKAVACIKQIDIFRGFLNEIMLDNFLTIKCEWDTLLPPLYGAVKADRMILERKATQLRSPPPSEDVKCSTYANYLAYLWANFNGTREALHVKEGTVKEWHICNQDMIYDTGVIHESIHYHHDVINRGYRILFFSGDHDVLIPYTGTMEWIESFNLTVVEPWRSWHVNGQVGGYTVRYSENLTFATVKGGGHEPSKERNEETSAIFRRWISHKPL